MPTNEVAVLWRGQEVGKVTNPKVDNFDLYGKWVPSDSALAKSFAARIESDGEIEVLVGAEDPPLRGVVEFIPSAEIEVKLFP